MLLCATGVWSFGPNGCAEKYAGEASRHRLADRAVQCGGNRGVRWTGARGPLARIAVFGTFRQLRSCGTRRPPPMSVRGLSGVGLTSAPHRTFADPAPPYPPTVPPLPLRILSSQMPPTPLACRPSPPLPSTDLGLAAGQPWDRVWQTCVLWGTCPRAASLSHVCHLLCPELPLGPLR